LLFSNNIIHDKEHKVVVIINFGGQYAHLIARRIRELGVFSILVNFNEFNESILNKYSVGAIILSGGPSSVLEKQSPGISNWFLNLNIPILGICYGHQLLAKILGGKINRGIGEYGPTTIRLINKDDLFIGWENEETVWMSHSDYVEYIPNSIVLALSENNYIAAFRVKNKKIYGVQFHPEVIHTPKGNVLLENFIHRIAGIKPYWFPEKIVNKLIEEIREKIPPEEKVLVAVSGGIDSTVTALLIKKAVGDRLVTVFVDHGLLREGEVSEILNNLNKAGIKPILVNARDEFLNRLEGVNDCEERRKIVGELFAKIFSKIIERDPSIKWLAQGTLYPDIIESGSVPHANKIKSHHNVAGLPKWFNLKIIEPLKMLYKDEVRKIAYYLGVPENIIKRHPFPGPGLSVRIIGTFTKEKLEIVRKASKIVEEVLKKHGIYDKVWQAFAVVGDDKWVGVKGDRRVEGYIVIVRIVESVDGMTADWARIPYSILEEISKRITSEIPHVTMVAYSITPKPPSTIEPC